MGWEYGVAEPSPRGLKALRTVHHVDLHWLLTGEPKLTPAAGGQSIDTGRFVKLFNNVSRLFESEGAELKPEGLLNISLAIFQEDPARDEHELKKLKLYIAANKRSRG